MAGLSIRNLAKRYGAVSVIEGLDLDIHDGEFLVLVGPSGCGKSTLLRMIAGLEEISDGTLSIDGQIVNDVPAARRDLSMVFQSYALYPHMTVRKNLAFGLQNLKMPRAEVQRRVDDAARALQIEPLLDRKPRQLSGGQKQRVAIGRAIVREPKLFLFDEPLSNLDAELRVQMRVELAALYNRLKATMIYVTHDQVEAMTLASRIVVLRGGKIEQVGTPHELYTRPANLFVAGFIGSPKINMLPVNLDLAAGRIHSADFGAFRTIALPDKGSTATICVRPEAVKLGAGDVSAQGKVRLVEYLGSESLVYVDLPSGETLLFHGAGLDSHKPGEDVTVGLNFADMHVFDCDGQRVDAALEQAA
ncbi:ABC transporter ATP-binding protein [Roseinatronobacter alkalisoli]|uniref:Sn-glycerol-3-phosphate ABC transporter ATP-binding protein UgpC n=1 Tax=Roseinatronobacter alkalisoli TaxID=3028235 RepID=A0ABT5TAK8_9RHOB|nr:sn-glycerol-3-phosphate ABC transporter ATP-binding protein UgpC [Roseinatronobacter sp. HJB301]MDD7970968.1 sn-glycerol-3-phosphate ABC transporter ATP-binding protein UgpC [Roseinatronobacter sp. HJB301]